MLVLNLATHRGWKMLKADAKSAFLQLTESHTKRDVFAAPVFELAEGLGLPVGQAACLLKAACGVASATRAGVVS